MKASKGVCGIKDKKGNLNATVPVIGVQGGRQNNNRGLGMLQLCCKEHSCMKQECVMAGRKTERPRARAEW